MLAAGPILCAILATLQVPTTTLGDGYPGSRAWGADLVLGTASGPDDAPGPGSHWASPFTYGETASGPSSQYNGRVYDPGTGFHDYGARMYWPQIGRFISADSVMGSPGSPMTLNRYSYVLNNPYKYVDPTGHYVEVQGERTEAALVRLRSTATGEKMYSQLRDSKRIFRLHEGGDGAETRPDDDSAARRGWRNGTGSGGTTEINYDNRFAYQDADGQWHQAEAAEVLGHELQHLVDYDNGNLDIGPSRGRGHPEVPVKEVVAIDTENSVRKELGNAGIRPVGGEIRISPKK